jgi:hypothetical protein
MHSDEYRRLHAAFLAMAEQSDLPDVQTRWLTLAQACFGLAKDVPAGFHGRKCVEDGSIPRTSARQTTTLHAA